MISPACFLASRIFDDSGFAGHLRSVPEDGGRVDIAFLKQALHEGDEKARIIGNVKPVDEEKWYVCSFDSPCFW